MYDIHIMGFDTEITYFAICLFTFLSSGYLFCKTCVVKPNKIQWIFLFSVGIGLSILFAIFKQYGDQFPNFVMYFSIPFLISILGKNNLITNLSTAFVVTAFYKVIKIVSSVLLGTILYALGLNQKSILITVGNLLVSFLICVLIMKVKRFRNGIQSLQDERYLGIGLGISGIVLLISGMSLENYSDLNYAYVILVLGSIITGFGLYLWIRRSITAHYRERMQLKSEEHYKEILENCDKEIEKLNQSNAYLAKIVHRDNHLLSNVNTSIDMYFNSDDEAYKETLLRELQTLAKERSEVINKEQLESKLLPSTGNLLIDGAINDLYIKAAAHGIDFNLTVTSTVDEIIGKYISQTDLQTLLCDHIKDAIIAVDSYGESGGKILVNLSKQNDNYCIDIYDSGVAFETDTLSKLGTERVTTDANSGGSGIGFMTTFETLRKAYASLIITEFEHRSPFSKSVSFRFDGESAFIINSYRKDELQQLITRNDVIYL